MFLCAFPWIFGLMIKVTSEIMHFKQVHFYSLRLFFNSCVVLQRSSINIMHVECMNGNIKHHSIKILRVAHIIQCIAFLHGMFINISIYKYINIYVHCKKANYPKLVFYFLNLSFIII